MNRITVSKDPTLSQILHLRLRELPFDAFASLITRLLPALGYQNVRLSGRRDFKGHNGRDGTSGFDMTATKCGRKVLIQLKQFEPGALIYQRSLDELRGVTLRSDAAEALLITSSNFSPSVDRKAHHLAPITPIATITGEELVELLIRYRIGVTRAGTLDESLLRQLTDASQGNSPGDCTGRPSFVVTIGVQRISRKKAATRR